jgi:hypothetical protein
MADGSASIVPAMPGRHPRRGPALRGTLVSVTVLGLLLAETLLTAPRRAAAGRPPADVVVTLSATLAGLPGDVAVVVARQHRVVPGLSPAAADARAVRTAAAVAAGGAAGDRVFPTASMVKLFLAEHVLHRARHDGLDLRADDSRLLRRMITASDDSAASALWVRYDGTRAVRDVARRYGLAGTAPPSVRGQWGRTSTTAGDLARFLALLPVVAHPDDAETLLDWMRAATRRAADGFDQRFGLFGATPDTAVKQGWMCCVAGDRHLHSAGVVGRTVVVLLSEVPAHVGYEAVARVLSDAVARLPAPGSP